MTDHSKIRAELSQRLSTLFARSGRLEHEIVEPLSADSSEQAVEKEDDETLAAEDALVIREIAAVRAAIGRIDSGRYGICVSCGEPISQERLIAVPEASLCRECM